jgi:hypothetical protein
MAFGFITVLTNFLIQVEQEDDDSVYLGEHVDVQ